MNSPVFSSPPVTSRFTTEPLPTSICDSITRPSAGISISAFSSSISAVRRIMSRSWSRFWFILAEIGTMTVSPPHSSGWRPCWDKSAMVRGISAPSRSILLIATIILALADLAKLIASMVWGLTPSSAATTITTMSVSMAPCWRIAAKASWPGVSRNVINLSSCFNW